MNASSLNPSEYTFTESGYQSILTTTENDTVNVIIYRCRASIPFDLNMNKISSFDVIVTVKGMQ